MTELPEDISIRRTARGGVFFDVRQVKEGVVPEERKCSPELLSEQFNLSFAFLQALFHCHEIHKKVGNATPEEIAGYAYYSLTTMPDEQLEALRSDERLWEKGILNLDPADYGYRGFSSGL